MFRYMVHVCFHYNQTVLNLDFNVHLDGLVTSTLEMDICLVFSLKKIFFPSNNAALFVLGYVSESIHIG